MSFPTKVVNGIHLPIHDSHFSEQILRNPIVAGKGTYQFEKVEAALAVARARGRAHFAIDIGAHVGLWTRMLARQFWYVLAFEPVPAHVHCFRKNLVDHGNVRVLDIALGEAERKIRLRVAGDDSGAANVDPEGSLEVSMGMLDALSIDPDLGMVDFIKIDVEGYEHFVVMGGENLIRHCRPIIMIEQKAYMRRYGIERNSAIRLLESWGMHVVWEKKGDFCMSWNDQPAAPAAAMPVPAAAVETEAA